MDYNRISLQPLATPGEVTTFYAYEGGAARNAALAALALHLAGLDGDAPVLVLDWDLEAPALHRHFLPAGTDAAMPDDARGDAAGAGLAGDSVGHSGSHSGSHAGSDSGSHAGSDPGSHAGSQARLHPDDQADKQVRGDGAEARPGLLEFFETCRRHLRGGAGPADELAERVLDAADWQAHIERADGRRPLYLMRAGRFDDSYAGRTGRLDWEVLFDACPALFRRFAARLAGHFRHVLVAAGTGRSAAVSVCSTLLPDRLVGVFTPVPGSLDGFEGVVRRAIDYRCTHEDEQRPLLVYPLACSIDGARSDPLGRWRRGDARAGIPGYQPRMEALLRACYGWPRVNLDSYFDEVQLALADAVSTAGPGGDRRALARVAAQLAEWVAPGRFPWQSLDEIRLRAALALARGAAQDDEHGAVRGGVHGGTHDGVDRQGGALADVLARLGALCRREGRRDEARACFEESLALCRQALGEEHAATRAARATLAALLFDGGFLDEARRHYDLLLQACLHRLGPDEPETLAARSQLARTLAGLGESERALVLHEQAVTACERALGADHPVTLDCLEDLAGSLVRQHETTRARIVLERVLDGRRRSQGGEHQDALRCAQRLALLLGEAGELGNARRMLEAVLRARERHDGPDAAGTLGAREALAEILAAQGDLAAVRSIQESLARTRERHLGAGHPDTLNMQLRLASTLGQQGEAEAAQRLRDQVAELRQRLQEAEGWGASAIAHDAGHAGRAPGRAAMASDAAQAAQLQPAHPRAVQAADNLGHKLAQLQDLIDNRSPEEARALADSLRTSVLKPSAAHPLRRRGAAMIKQVYLQEGDKDALLSFTQDEVSLLEGALIEASRDNPMTLR